jgi:hypothetical protein
VSSDDWQAWAVQAGVAAEVRAFIRFKPQMLFDFKPEVNPRAFPTPRSWEFVSKVLPHTPQTLVHRVVAGCVGEGPAAEFYGFLKMYQTLPDLDLVLASPTTATIPKEPDVVCAVIGGLIEKVRQEKTKAGAFAKYVTRFPDEYGMLGLRDLLAMNTHRGKNGQLLPDPSLAANPVVVGWIQDARKKGLFAGVVA